MARRETMSILKVSPKDFADIIFVFKFKAQRSRAKISVVFWLVLFAPPVLFLFLAQPTLSTNPFLLTPYTYTIYTIKSLDQLSTVFFFLSKKQQKLIAIFISFSK